jgi:hypothetical protein
MFQGKRSCKTLNSEHKMNAQAAVTFTVAWLQPLWICRGLCLIHRGKIHAVSDSRAVYISVAFHVAQLIGANGIHRRVICVLEVRIWNEIPQLTHLFRFCIAWHKSSGFDDVMMGSHYYVVCVWNRCVKIQVTRRLFCLNSFEICVISRSHCFRRLWTMRNERGFPLVSLRSSSRFLRLLPRLPVTSIPPFIFQLIICRRRQFLLKMWPIQLAFRLLISAPWLPSNTSSFLTRSVQLIFSILLQHHISKLSTCFLSTARSVPVFFILFYLCKKVYNSCFTTRYSTGYLQR